MHMSICTCLYAHVYIHMYAFRFGSGATLDVPSTQYAYEMRKGVWCLGVYDNQRSGAVIGAATMRNHEVRVRVMR